MTTLVELANEATNELDGDLVRICVAAEDVDGWERFHDLGAESTPAGPCAGRG